MKEADLKRVLAALGIKVEGRNEQRSKNRTWINFRCPLAPYSAAHKFQPDSRPSAGAVTDERGRASRWSCHACKAHGTLHDLALSLAQHPLSGIDYDKIAEEVIDLESQGLVNVQFGQDLGFDLAPEPLIEEAYEDLWPPAWSVPEARLYLQSRDIGQDTASSLGLVYDFKYRRVMFPVRDREGRLFGWTGRDITGRNPVRVLDYEGLPKRHMILGAERWQEGKPLIIVEGLFAYARLVELGIEEIANVGALLGSEMTEEKAEIIREFGEPTYLLTDADDAGDACLFGPYRMVDGVASEHREEGRGAVHLLTGHVPIFLPEYPEGKIDPDELTREEVETMLRCDLFGLALPKSFP